MISDFMVYMKWNRELTRQGKPWVISPGFAGDKFSSARLGKVECLVPILGREGRLVGVIGLGPRLSDEPYSGEDKRRYAGSQSWHA